jgi:hypothetical protein
MYRSRKRSRGSTVLSSWECSKWKLLAEWWYRRLCVLRDGRQTIPWNLLGGRTALGMILQIADWSTAAAACWARFAPGIA